MNVKVNDNVLVLAGKYKGKQGKVLKADPKAGKIIVEGVNIVNKHEKARRANETSKIVTEDGKKIRVCKKCGASLDKAYTKKSKTKPVEEAEAPKKRTRKRSQKAADAAETATEPENENKE